MRLKRRPAIGRTYGETYGVLGTGVRRTYTCRCRTAMPAASRRLAAPSLPSTLATWDEAVRGLINSCSAISGAVRRWQRRASTSRSRRVRATGSDDGDGTSARAAAFGAGGAPERKET